MRFSPRKNGLARQTYIPYALHAQGGSGQLRTAIVPVGSILTEAKFVSRYPEAFVVNERNGVREREPVPP